MQWISLRGWWGTVFSTGFSIRDSSSESAPIFRRVSVGMGLTPPRSSPVRGVFGARSVVPHLSSQIVDHVLALPSIPEGVTSIRVTAMCYNSTVVTTVDEPDGTVSRSLCSLAGRLLRWSECLDLHLVTGYRPGQSSVLADLLSHRDQVIGAEWSLHLMVAPALLLAWGSPSLDLFAVRFPYSVPSSRFSQVVFLDTFRVPWTLGAPWAYPLFHPSSRRLGGGSSRRAPILSGTLVAPLWPGKAWFAGLPLPSLWVSRFTYVVVWFRRSRQFRALSQPFTLSLPCKTWFTRLIRRFSMFLRISRSLSNLRSCIPLPGVCPSRPSGLDARSFLSSVECFLAQSLLFLLALASTTFTGVIHVFFLFESLVSRV